MKKKTVITTEKREVWVIRGPGEPDLQETKTGESESSESLTVVPNDPETTILNKDEK